MSESKSGSVQDQWGTQVTVTNGTKLSALADKNLVLDVDLDFDVAWTLTDEGHEQDRECAAANASFKLSPRPGRGPGPDSIFRLF